MKKAGLINLICSLIAVTVAIIAVMLTMIFTDIISAEPGHLVISSASATASYNGSALTDSGWRLLDGELEEGHRLSVTVSGSQTSVGISENYVSAKVLDEDGVDVSDMYKIEYRPGALNVKARAINITAASDMKAYDGTPLTADRYTVESAISLLPGDELEVTVAGSITDVGETVNEITEVHVYNKRGEDVTRNYSIRTSKGKLVIYAHDSIVIESDSETRAYNGQPLTNNNWRLTSGEVLPGHKLSVMVTGSRTTVGTSKNTISATILNEAGEDVSSLYSIVLKPGALTIIKQHVIITSGSDTKIYDSIPLICEEFTVSPSSAQTSNAIFYPNITGIQSEVGESSNTIDGCFVLDADGEDITANYEFEFVEGILKVVEPDAEMLPEIEFMTYDGEKFYDGTPLTKTGWEIFSGALLEGHTVEVNVTGSRTDVGVSDNTMDIIIRSEDGEKINHFYNIKKTCGVLTVKKTDITVTSDTEQKIYDGNPLVSKAFSVEPTVLGEMFSVRPEIIGSQTEVGESENTISAVDIFTLDGEKVTQNFNITKKNGILRVVENDSELKPILLYESASDTKVYDGTPLYKREFTRVAGELLPGHREEIVMTAEITAVGKISNTMVVNIYDAENNIVTEQYDIEIVKTGTLEVTPIEITITAADAEKVYDGTPLVSDVYSVNPPDAIIDGHELIVSISGSIIQPGEAKNVITNCRIIDGSRNDVTDMYKITVADGKLTVTAPPINQNTPLFEISSDTSEELYLKQGSYGNYDVATNTWTNALEYTEFLPSGSSMFFLPSHLLQASGAVSKTCYIKPLAGIFALPYYSIGNLTHGYGDTAIYGNAAEAYTVEYYSVENILSTPPSLTFEYSAYESQYRNFVYSNYLYVDSATRAYLEGIIAEQGFSVYDSNVVNAVAEFVKIRAKYNLNYNKALDSADNVVIAFLENFREGVCTHYSTAATLLYRTLGIPARYTLGIFAETVAGETVQVTAKTAHAWVEIYLDGLGWIPVEVTGSGTTPPDEPEPDIGIPPTAPGSGTVIKGPSEDIIENPQPVFKISSEADDNIMYLKQQSYGNYDGKNAWGVPLVYDKTLAGGQSVFFLPSYALANGGKKTIRTTITPLAGIYALPYHTSTVNNTSTDTAILGDGTAPYTINYYNWDNYAGIRLPSAYRDSVEPEYRQFVKENYLDVDPITLGYMQMIIEEQGLSVSDPDIISKVATYIKKSARYDLEYNKELDNAENVVVAFLFQYKAGICQHYASAATLLFRALGIPARYTVGYATPVSKGTVTTVTTQKAHAWVEVYIDGIGWQVVEVTGNGSSANGSDQPIKLTVKPVYTGAIYNGGTLYPKQVVEGLGGLAADGYWYELVVSGENTGLGTVSSHISTLRIYDSFDVLVYDKESGLGKQKFIVEYKTGEIQQYLSVLTFKSNSYTKIYDGKTLTLGEDDCYLVSGTLDEGYEYKIVNRASITDAGEIVSTFDVDIYKGGVKCNDHYKVNKTQGKLTVNKREITITAESATKVYDGNALTCAKIIYDKDALAEGDSITAFTVSGSITNIGKASNVIKSITIKNKSKDASSNYIINLVEGLLTVTPK